MPTLTNLKLSQVSYVMLFVRDTEKSLPFYRDTLGMTVKEAHPGWVELEAGSFTLALHGDDKLAEGRKEGTTVVFNVTQIEDVVETLKSRGVNIDKGIHEVCGDDKHVGLSADFRDADGNALSVFEYRSK